MHPRQEEGVEGTTADVSRVTVVVVSYNTREALARCLASLDEADEVVVVDNASADRSAEMVASSFPSAVLVQNGVNRGFGAACNQGLDAASGDYVLFLNSDAVARSGAVRCLASVLDRSPDVVACGGRLEFPDGRLQESCASSLTLWAVFCEQTWLEKAFPRSRAFSPYWLSSRLLGGADRAAPSAPGPFDVEQVMGACLMVRPVERFDERFFLYCEDTELCHRLRGHGRIVWAPSCVFAHELGSSSQRRWEAVARYNRGKELYFAIHHGRWSALVCFLLDRMGALLRVFVWGAASVLTLFLLGTIRPKFITFLFVLFAPIRGPARPDTDMP
jgi:GT2 family glycosyltransferase